MFINNSRNQGLIGNINFFKHLENSSMNESYAEHLYKIYNKAFVYNCQVYFLYQVKCVCLIKPYESCLEAVNFDTALLKIWVCIHESI